MSARSLDFLEWRGTSPKQAKFCAALVSHRQAIGLFGGAGGGGKSYGLRTAAVWLLGLAREHGFPGRRVVVAASTYNLLRDRMIVRFVEEYAGTGRFYSNHGLHGCSWIFDDPSMGVVAFRNLDDPGKYRGTECIASLVDEASELPEKIGGEEILSTLRYPIRMPVAPGEHGLPFLPLGLGSNPDGVGYSWLKRHFVDREIDESRYDPAQFVFVPALVEDNPFAGTEMIDLLDSLEGHLKAARRYGSWSAPSGARWPLLDRNRHRFRMAEAFPNGLPQGCRIVMGLDYGLKAPYAALWFANWDGDWFCFREDYKSGLTADRQAERIVNLTGANERVERIGADPAVWQRLPGHTGPTHETFFDLYHRVLRTDQRFGPMVRGFNRDRATALGTIDRLLDLDNGYPNLYIEEGCTSFWRELEGAVWDERGQLAGKREDIDPRNPDHAITACYYALHDETTANERPFDGTITARDLERSREIRLAKARERSMPGAKRRIRV